MSSQSIIVCATTESKSRKSKKSTIGSVVEIFQRRAFEYLYGPADHPVRTPEKHEMALSQAITAKQTKMHVLLILIVPENLEQEHMQSLSERARKADIEFDVITPAQLKFVADVAKIRNQKRQWNMGPQ